MNNRANTIELVCVTEPDGSICAYPPDIAKQMVEAGEGRYTPWAEQQNYEDALDSMNRRA
jgi:hypothetical protein